MKLLVLLTHVLPASLFAQTLKNIPEQPPVIMTVNGVDRDSDRVYYQPENLPQFPGGEVNFQSYLSGNTVYPEAEKDAGMQGDVYVGFVIEKDGSVSGVHEVHGVMGAPGLTQEALQLIAAMPRWQPGTNEGKPVRTLVIVPVKFVLNE